VQGLQRGFVAQHPVHKKMHHGLISPSKFWITIGTDWLKIIALAMHEIKINNLKQRFSSPKVVIAQDVVIESSSRISKGISK